MCSIFLKIISIINSKNLDREFQTDDTLLVTKNHLRKQNIEPKSLGYLSKWRQSHKFILSMGIQLVMGGWVWSVCWERKWDKSRHLERERDYFIFLYIVHIHAKKEEKSIYSLIIHFQLVLQNWLHRRPLTS